MDSSPLSSSLKVALLDKGDFSHHVSPHYFVVKLTYDHNKVVSQQEAYLSLTIPRDQSAMPVIIHVSDAIYALWPSTYQY